MRQVIEQDLRHAFQRALAVIFENKDRVFRPHLLDLGLQCCRDLHRRLVGNNCDPFLWLEPQADANRVARARRELGIDGIG